MSIVKMSYQCQCGVIIKIEGRSSANVARQLDIAVEKHGDEACG
jgi:hypothetical protein